MNNCTSFFEFLYIVCFSKINFDFIHTRKLETRSESRKLKCENRYLTPHHAIFCHATPYLLSPRLVSPGLVSPSLVSPRVVSLRLVSLRLVSSRLGSPHLATPHRSRHSLSSLTTPILCRSDSMVVKIMSVNMTHKRFKNKIIPYCVSFISF